MLGVENNMDFIINEDIVIGYIGKSVNVEIPEGIRVIGPRAFADNTYISSITLPESLIKIEANAFDGAVKLAEIINHSELDIDRFSSNHGKIARYAKIVHDGKAGSMVFIENNLVFYKEEDLYFLINYLGNDVSLILPNDIKSKEYIISKMAFSNTSVLSLTIPKTIMHIEKNAFASPNSLVEIYNLSTMWEVREYSVNFSLYTNEMQKSKLIYDGDFVFANFDGDYKLVSYLSNQNKELDLPDKILGQAYSIASMAFNNHTELERIYLSESTIAIDEDAFKGCKNLKTNTFDANQQYLGSRENPYMFLMHVDEENCNYFYHLNNNTKAIYVKAFDEADMFNIVIPKSMKYIPKNTFINKDINIFLEFNKDPEGFENGWSNKKRDIFIRPSLKDVTHNIYYYSDSKPLIDEAFWHYDLDGKVEIWGE